VLAAKVFNCSQVSHVAGNETTVRVDREWLVSMSLKIQYKFLVSQITENCGGCGHRGSPGLVTVAKSASHHLSQAEIDGDPGLEILSIQSVGGGEPLSL
jgi:hypothetical protein